MSLLTSIYSSILKIIDSNFQEMLLRGSTLQTLHQLDFDCHKHKVPFVISWHFNWRHKKKNIQIHRIVCLLPQIK